MGATSSMSFTAFNVSPGESATYFSTTTEREGFWYAIQVIETATFATLTAANWDGDSISGMQLGAGQIIYGSFTKIKLTSGKIIAYKR